MEKVDWLKIFTNWSPSPGGTLVTDSGRIKIVSQFCKYVADNMWGNIQLFGTETKRSIDDDSVSKNVLFDIAATQILEHGQLWEVTQKKFPTRLSYETALVIQDHDKVKYFKLQINEGTKGLASPSTVDCVWLDYHTSTLNIEVAYVKK